MKTFKVTVKQRTPYMQDQMHDESLEQFEKTGKGNSKTHDVSLPDYERALSACYLNKAGEHYIPAEHLIGCFINAGKRVKRNKRSMSEMVAGTWDIQPMQIIIPVFDEIDKRSAFNTKIKARILKIRPKWSIYKVSFTIHIDDEITSEMVRNIIEIGGNEIGIGSFTPRHKGKFGRFELVDFKEIKKN